MITLIPFNAAEHYSTISGWWTAQSWPVVPLDHLPQTGVVVTLAGKPAAACWIYKTDSAFALLEWIVADPEVRGEPRDSVLSTLISGAALLTRAMGFKTIHMSIKNASLAKRLEAQGFQPTDQGMTNYVLTFQGGE